MTVRAAHALSYPIPRSLRQQTQLAPSHENEGYAAVHIREMISDLPTKQRQALHLRYFVGLDYAEMATAMDCSEESARANVSQAMKKLKAGW